MFNDLHVLSIISDLHALGVHGIRASDPLEEDVLGRVQMLVTAIPHVTIRSSRPDGGKGDTHL